jgi:hypothetical protein
MRRGLRIAVASLSALALGLPAVASAATPISQSFTSTGEQQFVAPPGVTSVQVELVGGYGGSGNAGIPGGIPATDRATLIVSPGETLYAEVAGNGEPATGTENRGGYGGGADGAVRTFLFASAPTGGGGGGASDVQRCPAKATNAECGGHSALSSRLFVAGGGGGGGGNGLDPSTTAGGDGGSADQSGAAGAHDSWTDAGGGGGSRATSAAGGAAGASGQCQPSGSDCATAGVLGQGGTGAESDGGGGGGGIFGGGGGGAGEFSSPGKLELANGGGGGGGGGASGVPAGAAGVSDFSLVPTAEGAQPSVTFTWTPAPPAVVTAAASAVTSTTATLNGAVNPDAWQIMGCEFDISPAPSGVATIPCAQQLAAGGAPIPVSATALGLAPATTYTVTLNATSIQGTGSGSPVTFSTPTPPVGAIQPGGPILPSGALSVTNLKLSPTRFHRGTRAASIAKTKPKKKKKKKKAKTLPTSTTISFTLSQAAAVALSFELAQPGVLVGHKCTAASKTHAGSKTQHKGKRCTRYTTVRGGVTRTGHAGTDKITFAGVLDGGARLAPGTYRLSLSATGPGGSVTATQRPAFTLLG